ncbi:MAG: DUF2878 domain-containing protein [Desulfobulbales bacterium]|nr:DUF2878 domain-containing protein [Desulfobulbales bacterium]
MVLRKYSTPINFILFQVCWFACVVGAAYELGWLGPLLVTAAVPLQILLLTEHRKSEALFVVICGLAGFVLESLLIAGNIYAPVNPVWGRFSPPWMTALWFNFAMLTSISLAWLKGKYLLAAVLGGIFGPLAYWGGEKLGAIILNSAFVQGYLPLALVWALALPCLIYIHTKLTFA